MPTAAPDSAARHASERRICGSSGPCWCGARAFPPPLGPGGDAAFVVGGVLLLWSAYIHFHLWGEPDGYRSIATIGPLFLLQSIAGARHRARRHRPCGGSGPPSSASASPSSTLAGFLLSVAHGLFGFKDSWLAPFAKQAFGIELVAAAVLIIAAALCLVGSAPHARAGTTPAGTAT